MTAAFSADFPLRDKGVSNALSTGELPRHRWYFVKEGFSPDLVDLAIDGDGVGGQDLVFDPFSGGGTVPLAAVVRGLKTESIEVNPFLHFLSSTKVIHTNPIEFGRSARVVEEGLSRPVPSRLEGYSTFTKGNRWNRWLFPKDILRSYEGAYRKLSEVPTKHKNLLKLALLGAAMDCCNASRDGKCLRFSKDWERNQSSTEALRAAYRLRVGLLIEDLATVPLAGREARITQGDARKMSPPEGQKFRLCVTSPPYLNSFDYSDVYRPELFLGGFVDSNNALMKIRLQTIRSHVQATWEAPTERNFGSLYGNCIAEILAAADELWDPRIPKMIQAYFEDMASVLRNLRSRALDNASVWLVVSTSAYAGVQVPVDLILAEIGERNGWILREVGVLRNLRSSSQHVKHVEAIEQKSVPLRESVVIFDAVAKKRARSHMRGRSS